MATFATQQPPTFGQPTSLYSHRPSYSHTSNTFSSFSTPPSANISPTNYHPHVHARQLHQPKQCLYVPAALRPTEMSCARGGRRPLTPPRSVHGSLSSKDSSLSTGGMDNSISIPSSPNEDGSMSPERGGIISRVVTDEWNEQLGQVTGVPTRNHWKPDSTATVCTSPTCTTIFTFLHRRHHCRRCGNIFCTPHSAHAVPLDQEARFHPEGTQTRACDLCWADFQLWRHARTSRANSSTSTDASASTAIRLPSSIQDPLMGMGGNKNGEEEMSKSYARVVAMRNEDWNWSTF